MSETGRYRHLTVEHCQGNGVDVGSQGDPVVPWAIQVELPHEEYMHYTSNTGMEVRGAWRGDGRKLPFQDRTLDFVYSSHLLEDFEDWTPALRDWLRVLKQGGKLVILMPDNALWNQAIANGQPPNCAHKHCGSVGELTTAIQNLAKVRVIEDRLTNLHPGDYTILFIAEKL